MHRIKLTILRILVRDFRGVWKEALLGLVLCVLLPALGVPALAQVVGEPGQRPNLSTAAPAIRLRAATFVPSRGEEPALRAELLVEAASLAAVGRAQYLVQCAGPILAAWRASIEATGATILDYIPDYAYKVEADSAALARLRELPNVIWVGPYHPGYRISPELQGEGRQAVRIELDDPDADALVRQLPGLGARLVGQEGRSLLVEADASKLPALSRAAHVRWLDRPTLPRPQNDIATGEIHANLAWDAGYAGEGQLVAVADTGLDTGVDYPQVTGDMHRDLDNRVTHIRSWPISPLFYAYLNNPLADDGAADLDTGHGTHVAGSAVGNGYRSEGRYRGVAHRATLAFQALEQYCDFNADGEAQGYSDGYTFAGIPADLNVLYQEAYTWGARIHSNSWGIADADQEGLYTEMSRQTDQFVWTHRDMAILFAAGNAGRDANGDGHIDYGSIAPPATAKNILAVGGTENRRPERTQSYGQAFGSPFPANPIRDDSMANAGVWGMAAFSARGPTRDGRLAPHVVAPGTWVASLRSSRAARPGWPNGSMDPYYVYDGGTSMSTPLVAGGLALVRQAYLARGHAPSAALLKATLIQSTQDIPGQYPAPYGDAGPIPNNDEGWGAIDLRAAVAAGRPFVDGARALHTGEQITYTYRASASPQPARFTLVWTDYPAAVEAATQWVNDLDLEVTTPDGKTYRGNVFAGGWSALAGSPDRANNVECVYLPATQAGHYTVTIRAHNVPQGPQDFALLVGMPGAAALQQLALPLVLRAYQMVTPTATPTPTMTPTSTPTLAPGEFRDDFSAVNGVWYITATQTYTLEYASGEYRIWVVPEQPPAGSLSALQCEGDLLLEVEGRAVGAAAQAYGLLFNYREGTGGVPEYHALLVSPTGYYALARWQGAVETAVVPWTASSAILPGAGTNWLAVRRIGQQVQCSINGTPVLTLSRAEFTGGSRLGLIALCYGPPYADARFDNLHLLPLQGGLPGINPSGLQAVYPRHLDARNR